MFCHYSVYSLCFVWVHHGGVKHSFSLALFMDILRSKAYFWLLWRPFAEEELSTHSSLACLCALLNDVGSLVWWRVCDGLMVYVAGLCRSDVSRRPNLVHLDTVTCSNDKIAHSSPIGTCSSCIITCSTHTVALIKGRTIRKVMGGEGNFRAAGIFFRYQIPCMNFFKAIAWIFFRVNWRAIIFFHLIFPCANFFFCTSPPPPPPHKFSNGPCLRTWSGNKGTCSAHRNM